MSPFLFDNYAEQQYQELLTLLDAADTANRSILMGDFNHGPTVATHPSVSSVLHAELPFNYGYVQARGYYSPYTQLDRRCTICYENPAVSLTSKIVDHIYVSLDSSERVVATTVNGLWLVDPSVREFQDCFLWGGGGGGGGGRHGELTASVSSLSTSCMYKLLHFKIGTNRNAQCLLIGERGTAVFRQKRDEELCMRTLLAGILN